MRMLTVRMTADLYEKFQRYAAQQRKSMNQAAIDLLTKIVKDKPDELPMPRLPDDGSMQR